MLLLEPATGAVAGRLSDMEQPASALASDGGWLAAASVDGTIHLWRV